VWRGRDIGATGLTARRERQLPTQQEQAARLGVRHKRTIPGWEHGVARSLTQHRRALRAIHRAMADDARAAFDAAQIARRQGRHDA